MKTTFHLGLLCAVFTLLALNFSFAQIRLDVEGDANITGKLRIDDDTNIIIGNNTGVNNTGEFNVLLGRNVGINNSGDFNVFMGNQSGRNNTTGGRNVFVGRDAGLNNTTGIRNTFIGYSTGNANVNSNNITFLGAFAGQTNPMDSLTNAMAIGYNAKVNCSNCAVIGGIGVNSVNVGIGTDNPSAILDVEGDTKIRGKIDMVLGNENVFIGTNNAINISTGINNILIGTNTGRNITTGISNTIVGRMAGRATTEGSFNTFVGQGAGNDNVLGEQNTYIGNNAGNANSNGTRNTYVGVSTGAGNTNSRNMTLLGFETGQTSSTDTLNKAIAIGYRAKVNCSNCAVIGGSSVAADAVNVGIGTDTPQARLHVTGSVRFDDLPDGSGTNLQIDGSGNLVIAASAQKNQVAEIELLRSENEALKMRLEQLEQTVAQLLSQTETRSTQKARVSNATLQQNAPNPFTETTNINYFIPTGTKSASLQVMDQNGRIIKSIPIQARGKGQVQLQANLLNAGTYHYSLILDGQVMDTKQMVLMH